uniref:Uncharacterized protein n=1 Tax=Podarcis muralis TaxID=64176 RepID=A0A670IE24_PODMU
GSPSFIVVAERSMNTLFPILAHRKILNPGHRTVEQSLNSKKGGDNFVSFAVPSSCSERTIGSSFLIPWMQWGLLQWQRLMEPERGLLLP